MKYQLRVSYKDGVVTTSPVTGIEGVTPAQLFDLQLMAINNTFEDTLSAELLDESGNTIAGFNFPQTISRFHRPEKIEAEAA